MNPNIPQIIKNEMMEVNEDVSKMKNIGWTVNTIREDTIKFIIRGEK